MAAMASLIKAIPFVDRDSKPPLSLKWRNPSLRTTQISLIPSSMMIKNSSSSSSSTTTTTTAAGFNIRTIKCSSSINNDRRGGSDFRVHNNSKKNGFSMKQSAALLGGFSQQADYFGSSNYLVHPTNRKPFSIIIGAEKGDGGGHDQSETNKDELKEAAGNDDDYQSSVFSKLSLKAPSGNSDPPLIWWLLGVPFLLYMFATWQIELWQPMANNLKELAADLVRPIVDGVGDFFSGVNGVVGPIVGPVVEPVVKSVVVAVVMTVVVPLLLAVSGIFYFFTDPTYAFSSFIDTLPKIIAAIYSGVVNSSVHLELLGIILLTSLVLAIADVTVPRSVNSQHNLLTVSGIVAFTSLNGSIPQPLVWLFVVGSFYYSRYVKRRDYVSSALPSATVLTAVGEPGLILVVMVLYLTLGIYQHSKKLSEENRKVELARTVRRRIPVPLLVAALAIGILVATKWVQYEQFRWRYLTTSHLTWIRYPSKTGIASEANYFIKMVSKVETW